MKLNQILCNLTLFIVLSSFVFNQMPADYTIGFEDGVNAAADDKKWIAAGCCFTLTGVGVAYLVNPEAKGAGLVGKSSDYVLGYKDGFKKEQKKMNTKNAWIGCATTGILYCGCYFLQVLMAVSASG